MPIWTHVATSLKFAINNIDTGNDKQHVLEFGTGGGRSIKYIRAMLREKTPKGDIKKNLDIFGFDSHIGLPEDWTTEISSIPLVQYKEALAVSSRERDSLLKEYDQLNIKFYCGWFKDTLPEYINIAKNIALLHIDCDIYSSTIEVLYSLNQFIVSGTIIVFDEWIYNYNEVFNDHEQKAFYEWVEDKNRKFEFLEVPKLENLDTIEQKTIKILK